MEEKPNFEGHQGRDCGEHRTVGSHRAWCFDCTAWCYPEEGCPGCQVPQLLARISSLEEGRDRLAALVTEAREYEQRKNEGVPPEAKRPTAEPELSTIRRIAFEQALAALGDSHE